MTEATRALTDDCVCDWINETVRFIVQTWTVDLRCAPDRVAHDFPGLIQIVYFPPFSFDYLFILVSLFNS